MVVETTEHAEATRLLEGVASDKLPVMVVYVVVSPADGCAVACLISPTAKVVRVHRGTRLGQVEQLPDSAVVSVVMEGQSSCEVAPGNGASNKILLEMMQQDGDGCTLSQTQRDQLLQTLKKHRKPFSEGTHGHGQTNRVQHSIHTVNSVHSHAMFPRPSSLPRRIAPGQRGSSVLDYTYPCSFSRFLTTVHFGY